MASQAVTLGVIERLKVISMMQHKCQARAAPYNKSHCMFVSISILSYHSVPQKQGTHSSSTTRSLLNLVTEHAHNHSISAIFAPAQYRVPPKRHLSLLNTLLQCTVHSSPQTQQKHH